MNRQKLTRLAAMLLMICQCITSASAAGVVREEDFEVVPDYSQMDAEAAVRTYLSREMKLNPAAVCGILANIEYESAFIPGIWGDEGTSFGLCQWHEIRSASVTS